MNINDILGNKELMLLLNNSIEKTYNRFKLHFIIEKDDFMQEAYIYLISRIKKFDSERSTLKTYIPLIVMSCARAWIQSANGRSKEHNKLDFKNNTLSFETTFNENENGDCELTLEDNLGYSEENEVYNKILINEILSMNNLTENQKLILMLMSKGYTMTDIATKINRKTNYINITFQRAKEKIVRKYNV